MLVRADVLTVDTAPDQLRISTQAGRLPAVVVHEVEVGRDRLELRILAASHQVVVEVDGGPGRRSGHVETVACGLASPSAAPLVEGRLYGHGGWCVAASVVSCDAVSFARQARRWIERGRDDERCVAVRFPNHPHALTAVAVDVNEVSGSVLGWTGVHLYPSAGGADAGGGAVVRTTTRRTPAAGALVTSGPCAWEVPV
jgi:hypothetical protein